MTVVPESAQSLLPIGMVRRAAEWRHQIDCGLVRLSAQP